MRRPASATWVWIATDPMTKAIPPPGRPSARTCWIAPPTVTTSSREAWKPSAQSLRTKSSPDARGSLVRKATCLPAAVTALRAAGKHVAFLTNDPRASGEDFVRKLWALGFQASLDEVVTVGGAIQHVLAEGRP